jgi:glycosyltransferase involved in cell wall biosynthesis
MARRAWVVTRNASTPTFSIVIPTYNRASELGRCLQGVMARTDADDVEVIVVDDGSSDRTEAVARGLLDGRGTYVRQANAGPCVARNHGAERATGRMLVFLDSDDELTEAWSPVMSELVAAEGTRVHLASAAVTVHESHTGRVTDFPPPHLGAAFGGFTASFVPGTYALDRAVFGAVGGFAADIPYGEHHELALRVAAHARDWLRVRSSSVPVVLKHHDRSPAVERAYLRSKLVATERTLDRHREACALDPVLTADFEYVAGYCAAHLGDFRRARSHYVRSLVARRRWKPALGFAAALVPGVRNRVFDTEESDREVDRPDGPEAP